MLGSGNLGLVYLMEESRRLTMEEIEKRHPRLLPALGRTPAHRLSARALRRARPGGDQRARHALPRTGGAIEGVDPLAPFSPNAPAHLQRTDGFEHVADIMVGSFYDPELEQGCAFEELISFHGGLGGPQTQPFVLYPVELPVPGEPIVGAAAVHELLSGWRDDAPARVRGRARRRPGRLSEVPDAARQRPSSSRRCSTS